jgi:hypothetical protein
MTAPAWLTSTGGSTRAKLEIIPRYGTAMSTSAQIIWARQKLSARLAQAGATPFAKMELSVDHMILVAARLPKG